MKYSKIIFVCQDNSTLSPMAEAIFHHYVKDTSIEVISRGLVVLFPEPFNENAQRVLKAHDISFVRDSTAPFDPEEVNDETLILTMNINQTIKLAEEYGLMENVSTFRKFAGEEGDLADPFGAGYEEYEKLYEEMLVLTQKMMVYLT